jgi:hypothetical protein
MPSPMVNRHFHGPPEGSQVHRGKGFVSERDLNPRRSAWHLAKPGAGMWREPVVLVHADRDDIA